MAKLYKKIILDWRKGCKDKNVNYSISTVAHFIKQRDKCSRYRVLSCGYADLRKDIQKQADVLISMFESSKTKYLKAKINYLNRFSGIDAAGNELYARPEVFAPVFDYLNAQFKERFSNKTAIAPTASISIICGGASPGVEPVAANSFTHKTLSGSYSVRNKYVQKVLEKHLSKFPDTPLTTRFTQNSTKIFG